ncbi:hypothetical protein [Sphingomonas mollis]|uniref:hypothetical protein n=1 Tax=Sphingomonas mollis TaxID=2795726 RepID=UPI0018ECF2A8|nr:hypothetical protein [Sphingomonas sp. BT553]
MDEPDAFRAALWTYVGRQPSKRAAADALGITRTDLYRYLGGDTAPRSTRREEMMRAMATGMRPMTGLSGDDFLNLSVESVTQLRDILLHLVSLLDLDLASRRVNERKGG